MAGVAVTHVDASAARRAAAAILRESRFRSSSVPRPLHGVLHAIGRVLQRIGHAISSPVDALGRHFPGGPAAVWVLIAVALIAVIAFIARHRADQVLLRGHEQLRRAAPQRILGPADLDREAERAEREGRFADAVRLGFQSGLARLEEQGKISGARSTPTGRLTPVVQSGDFDQLVARFDEIAYGASPAVPADVEDSRRRWAGVLAAGGRR